MQRLLIYILLFFPYSTFAQDLSGEIHYTVKHDWIKKISHVDYMSKSRREHFEYVWGNDSEYIAKSILRFSPIASRYEDVQDQSEHVGHSWRASEYIIFRDLENKMSYDLMRMFNKLYLLEDTIQNPQWKMLNDMKEIAGHICMNAICKDTIKDNNIMAWFALDWPQSIGPDEFGGLPGVILEININDGAMVISAEEIVLSEKMEEIQKPSHKKRVKRITNSEYDKLLLKYIEECKAEERPYFWGFRY